MKGVIEVTVLQTEDGRQFSDADVAKRHALKLEFEKLWQGFKKDGYEISSDHVLEFIIAHCADVTEIIEGLERVKSRVEVKASDIPEGMIYAKITA